MNTQGLRRLDDWTTWFRENMGRPQLFYAAVVGTQRQQQQFLLTMIHGNIELMDYVLEQLLDIRQFKERLIMHEALREQAARTLHHFEVHKDTLMSPEKTWKFLLEHQWEMLRMFLAVADEIKALHLETTQQSVVEIVNA